MKDLIDQFIARYRKEYDFYDKTARLTAQLLDQSLQSAGLRAIVTSRAKALGRLEDKVRQRSKATAYASVQDIFDDIVDLAGVRVALYFPGERDEVGKIIEQLFDVTSSPKSFPDASKQPTRDKRFSGYWATHYRVRLRDNNLNESDKRYGLGLVEIQVASVLMHAWSEVEHDLVYKPLQGALSTDEYAILDQLNGMVISGEIALEQLQRAGKVRVAEGGREFANHYDLADHLLDKTRTKLTAQDPDPLLGRVNVLFRLLVKLGFATPDKLAPFLIDLNNNLEKRPLADQVIDRVIADDADRYKIYQQIRESHDKTESSSVSPTFADGITESDKNQNTGRFLTTWIRFERLVRDLAGQPPSRLFVLTPKILQTYLNVSMETLQEMDRLRRLRNNLVHGVEPISDADLEQATRSLMSIIGQLEEQLNEQQS